MTSSRNRSRLNRWMFRILPGTALLTALLGTLFWLDVARVWHVYAILFLRSLADCFQTPAMTSTAAWRPF